MSVQVGGGPQGEGVPPGRGSLQVVRRQGEPLRGQLEAREAEVPDLREGEAALQGRLGRREDGPGLGRLAVAVQQVLDEERRVLRRRARLLLLLLLLQRLWRRFGHFFGDVNWWSECR